VLYILAKAVIGLLKVLPLTMVARLGRTVGGLFYWLDARHRKVAIQNLTRCFGQEKSTEQIRSLARENFRRIGENFASAAKTAFLEFEQFQRHVEVTGTDEWLSRDFHQAPQSRIIAIGHFGNFEAFARLGEFLPQFRCATTYRGLRQPGLDRLMKLLRERSGCRCFERRTEAAALRAAIKENGSLLGLFADQHAGDGGLRLPFLGHDCSTSAAPAIFALRYGRPLHLGICYRVGLAQWRLEFGEEIQTRRNGKPRSVEDICTDINRAFEKAIRRDPANWFWVHNRWKPARLKLRRNRHFAEAVVGSAIEA
jgi:KDO2-lipid IV(A) lauroyltransferase